MLLLFYVATSTALDTGFKEMLPFPQSAELSQSSRAESIYATLDKFLENVSQKNIDTFSEYLEQLETKTNPDRLAQVIALNNLAYFERKFGRLQDAITHYNQAWRTYQEYQLRGIDILESCLKPLGNLYTQTNALGEAQKTIEQCLLLARKEGNTDTIVGGIANLSVVYYSGGNFRQAIQILEEGLKIAPDHPNLWMNLASNLYAVEAYNQSVLAVRKSMQFLPEQPNGFKLLAQLYLTAGKYDAAEKELKNHLEALKKDPSSTARIFAKGYKALAEIQYQKATQDQSPIDDLILSIQKGYAYLIPQFGEGALHPEREQLYAENTLMDLLDLHAKIYFDQDNPTKGFELFDLAFEVSEAIAFELMAQESELALRASARTRSEAYLNHLAQRMVKNKSDSLIEKALRIIENSKNRVVNASYMQNQLLQMTVDDAVTSELRRVKQNQAQITEEMLHLRHQSQLQSNRYASLLDAYQNNMQRIKTLNRERFGIHGNLSAASAVNLSKLQEKSEIHKDVLLDYFIGKEASYLITINGGQTSFQSLTRTSDEHEEFLSTYRTFIAYFDSASKINDNPQGYAQIAYELYNWLKIPNAKNLIISPDGVLNFVPYSALLTAPSTVIQYTQMPFLIKASSVSYTLSAERYLDVNEPLSKNPSALGVFPVFEGTDTALPYSIDEATALASRFDTELLMREEAGGDSAFAKADNHNILHFSTHATGGSFSRPAALKFYDVEVPVTRFYGELFHPDLVVLSACETGVGKLIAGENAQSLARGFQYAGARNVLFSLWQVNDRSTATVMDHYYNTLKKTRSRDQSLGSAQRLYLQENTISNTQKSPYYWAPFVYYGSTDVVTTDHTLKWVLGGVFLVLLMFLIYKYGVTTRVPTR